MQHAAPELVRIRRERVVGECVDDDPRRLVEFGLELPGAPPGVAGEEPEPPDGEVLRLGVSGHEAKTGHDRRRGLLDVVELGEHHERLGLDRPADEDRVVGAGESLECRDGVERRNVRRAAEDEAHRAVVVVVRDQHDRLPEVRVDEGWGGDEQLALQGLHYANRQPSPSTNVFRTRRATTWRCTSSGPS